MEPFALFLFALALLVNAGTPGPSIAALVSRVISSGWRDIAGTVALTGLDTCLGPSGRVMRAIQTVDRQRQFHL